MSVFGDTFFTATRDTVKSQYFADQRDLFAVYHGVKK